MAISEIAIAFKNVNVIRALEDNVKNSLAEYVKNGFKVESEEFSHPDDNSRNIMHFTYCDVNN